MKKRDFTTGLCAWTPLSTFGTAVPSVQCTLPDWTAISIRDSEQTHYRQTQNNPPLEKFLPSFTCCFTKSSWFSTQAQAFSSLHYVIKVHGTKILATMPYVDYELCIVSIPCLRLLWNFHLRGLLSLLFLCVLEHKIIVFTSFSLALWWHF